MFKPVPIPQSDQIAAGIVTADDEDNVKRIFMVFLGFYGNLFLSKFQTGTIDEVTKEDQGVQNARRMWAFDLRQFDGETIKTALRLCKTAHVEFPPSLPQFSALCAANQPRKTYADTHPPAIGMSQKLRSRYAAQAREIVARHNAKGQDAAAQRFAPAPGLESLKQVLAEAVGAAGGDEAAALVRLNRMWSNNDGDGAR